MTVYTSNREPIKLTKQPFASGGEGAVYKVTSSPSWMKNVCVKIYHEKKLNSDREKRIKYMVANPPPKIQSDGFIIGWPIDCVTDKSGNFLGFVMPMGFADSKELTVLTSTTISKKHSEEWHHRYDRKLGKTSLVNRLKLISNIAIPVHFLHSTGKYVLRDFKPQNVLITANGCVTICDMDSIQIVDHGHLLFPATAHTPDYIPPEYHTLGIGKKLDHIISTSWDMFAVGVVFYEIIFGLHPYTVTPRKMTDDSSNDTVTNIANGLFPFGRNAQLIAVIPKPHNNFNVLPKSFKDLFLRTFTDDTGNRPNAEMWGKTVYQLVVEAERTSQITTSQTTKHRTSTTSQATTSSTTATAGSKNLYSNNSNSCKNNADIRVSSMPSGRDKPTEQASSGNVDESNQDNEIVPIDVENKITKWRRLAGFFYILAILSFIFMNNYYYSGFWSYWNDDGVPLGDMLTYVIPIGLLGVLWYLRPSMNNKGLKYQMREYYENKNPLVFPIVSCLIVSCYIFYDIYDNMINNMNYYCDDILNFYLGPILAVFFWCIAIYCLYKMRQTAYLYLNTHNYN